MVEEQPVLPLIVSINDSRELAQATVQDCIELNIDIQSKGFNNVNFYFKNQDFDPLLKILHGLRESQQIKSLKITLEKYRYSIFSDKDIEEIVQAILPLAPRLQTLHLGLRSWGDKSDGRVSDKISLSIACLIQNLHVVEHLGIDLFENGLENPAFSGESVVIVTRAIREHIDAQRLKSLTLDFGRLGCERYKSLKLLERKHVASVADALSKFTSLNKLFLNFRSWGYDNHVIGDQEIGLITEQVQRITHLQELDLSFYMWGYKNTSITNKSLFNIYKMLLALPELCTLNLNMRRFENVSFSSINFLLGPLSNMTNLRELRMSVELWRYQENDQQIEEQEEKYDFSLARQKKILNDFMFRLGLYTQQDQIHIDLLCDLNHKIESDAFQKGKQQRKKYFKCAAAIQKYLGAKYRREILWEVQECCFLSSDSPKQEEIVFQSESSSAWEDMGSGDDNMDEEGNEDDEGDSGDEGEVQAVQFAEKNQ